MTKVDESNKQQTFNHNTHQSIKIFEPAKRFWPANAEDGTPQESKADIYP